MFKGWNTNSNKPNNEQNDKLKSINESILDDYVDS